MQISASSAPRAMVSIDTLDAAVRAAGGDRGTSRVTVFDGRPLGALIRTSIASGLRGNALDSAVIDGARRLLLPQLAHSGAATANDADAGAALTNITRALDFYRSEYGRDSWDGAGAPTNAVVHIPGGDGYSFGNAYVMAHGGAPIITYGDGGNLFTQPGSGRPTTVKMSHIPTSYDITVHELTHAVQIHETTGDGRYPVRWGLMESSADVIAQAADPSNTVLGEDATSDRGGYYDTSRLPFTDLRQLMGHPLDQLETHQQGFPATTAAMRFGDAFGRSAMGHVWYDALTQHRELARGDYPQIALSTVAAATARYGWSSAQVAVLTQAWRDAGVTI